MLVCFPVDVFLSVVSAFCLCVMANGLALLQATGHRAMSHSDVAFV